MKYRFELGYLFAAMVAVVAVAAVTVPLLALAQAMPAAVPSEPAGIQGWLQAFTNIPALGLVMWLAHRLITQTIPRLANDFKEELGVIRKDFKCVLEQQREDTAEQAKLAREEFVKLIERQQGAFEDMATQQAQSYESSLQREREFHKKEVDGILLHLKEGRG